MGEGAGFAKSAREGVGSAQEARDGLANLEPKCRRQGSSGEGNVAGLIWLLQIFLMATSQLRKEADSNIDTVAAYVLQVKEVFENYVSEQALVKGCSDAFLHNSDTLPTNIRAIRSVKL